MTRKEIKRRRLLKHFAAFVDKHYFPDFKADQETEDLFLLWQSQGRAALNDTQQEKIRPLIYAQEMKELTIKMVVQDMCDWWSHGWGWYYPIHNTIRTIKNDNLFKVALLKIQEKCHKDFMGFVLSYTGLTQDQKKKYLAVREMTCVREMQKQKVSQ